MLSGLCDYSSCLCDVYIVSSVMMIVIILPFNCAMGLWSPIFSLNYYSIHAAHMPFIMIPSMTTMSSLNDQYAIMSQCTCSLLSGQPAMTYPYATISAHLVQLHVVFAVLTYIHGHSLMSVLNAPLHPCHVLLHLCGNSQSVMMISGTDLYVILNWHWCILRKMCLIYCDRVATSFLNIGTRGL